MKKKAALEASASLDHSVAFDLEELTKIKVTMFLADYALVSEGKLSILGGGWNITGPDPTSFGLAVLFEIPIVSAQASYSFRLELIDAEGVGVQLTENQEPLIVEGGIQLQDLEAARESGSAFLNMPFAANFAALPLPPGKRLEWRLLIDGRGHADWRLPFTTRAR